jgi:hypothetical protein
MAVKITEIQDTSGHDYKDPNIPDIVPIGSNTKLTVTATHPAGVHVKGEIIQNDSEGNPTPQPPTSITDDTDTSSTLVWGAVNVLDPNASLSVENRINSNDGEGRGLSLATISIQPDDARNPGVIFFPRVHKDGGTPELFINHHKQVFELWVSGIDPAQVPGPARITATIDMFDPNNQNQYYPPLIGTSQSKGPLFLLHFDGLVPALQGLTMILSIKGARKSPTGHVTWVLLVGDIRINFV